MYTILQGAKIMFDAIWKFLNKVLPKQQTTKRDSKRSIQLAQHDAFLASRHKMYGVGDNNLSSLVKLLNQGMLGNFHKEHDMVGQ